MLKNIQPYIQLIRLDKPVGIYLLLWPTLWGLWAASHGMPSLHNLVVFTLGTILMRSAGCAINDYADRDFDKHVLRTQDRPITSGQISPKSALIITAVLSLLALGLIFPYNNLVKGLAIIAAFLATSYPFTKRFLAIPQAYLGLAFGFGIVMAFAAVKNTVPSASWLLVLATVFWAIAYDTAYAMVDKADDLKIGIKTSAITFGDFEVDAIALCYGFMLICLGFYGYCDQLSPIYFVFLIAGLALAVYFVTQLQSRNTAVCFTVFKQNHWLGIIVLCGFIAATL